MRAKNRNLYPPKGVPTTNYGEIVVNTGLSILTACGHVIELNRDAGCLVAEIRVSPNPNGSPVRSDSPALSKAVEVFESRASRFLGSEWTVLPWDGEVVSIAPPAKTEPQPPTAVGKTAGYVNQGSGV